MSYSLCEFSERTPPDRTTHAAMVLKRILDWFRDDDAPRAAPERPPAPRHFGDLWNAIQQIAEEEDPEKFTHKSVTDHAAESLEGKKDVDRWLEIYRSRTIEDHVYRFPQHHTRCRGYCLIPRHWPNGTLWEAYDEESLLKAKIGPERTREELVAAIERHVANET